MPGRRTAAVRVRRRGWAGARTLGGGVVLAVLVRQLGTGPFLDGLRGLSVGTLLAALAIGAVTTVLSAWRWRIVSAALGDDLPLPGATAACYRSQFLNSTLPGGVVGDVHRGLRHGADVGDLGRGVRGVLWERVAGQVVLVAVTVAALLVLPSPVHAAAPQLVAVSAVAAGVLLVTGRRIARHAPARAVRALRTAAAEARSVLLQPTAVRSVLVTSLLVLGGHLGMFWLAARAVGVDTPPQQLLPLALVVLLAAAIPFNVAGWGPREGAAAWLFAATEWGAGAGAAVATAFGVLTLVAVLPGAAVLIAGRRRPPRALRPPLPRRDTAAVVVHNRIREEGAAHG